MNLTVQRSSLEVRLTAVFSQTSRLAAVVEPEKLPDNLEAWLRNLMNLTGVPFNYLVPDEGMLPPESIRFFYLDPNWIDALIDGAYSIGRNLTDDSASPMLALDKATSPGVTLSLRSNSAALRAANLGQPEPVTTRDIVCGFLLRSSVVPAYPGLGVFAYDANGKMLNILRFERLGDDSDTMICLIDGDAIQIDIHEAPEHLHYGVDSYAYNPADGKVTANKFVHPFTVTDGKVDLKPGVEPVDISACFRSGDPRTVKVASLAAALKVKANPTLPYLDAAQMGFEMTQGVGMVSFTDKSRTS